MTDEQITREAYKISNNLEEANQEYIELLCTQLGELSDAEEINYDRLYDEQEKNIKKIQDTIQTKCALVAALTVALYLKSGQDVYKDMSVFYKAKNVTQPAFYKNWQMQAYMRQIANLTNNTFMNLSRTTVVDKTYRDAIDKAVKAVHSGDMDINTAIRKVASDSAIQGTRVEYASGYTRRLDSAARMNILAGVRQLNMGISRIAGEQFGADGMEINAHGLCAPDHLDIQGEQYTMEEYDAINGDLARPIGEMNCQHIARPIVLGVSTPTYSEEQLQELAGYSNEIIDIDGKEVTRYQASQLMRNLETQARYQKDLILAGKSVNDPVLTQKAKDKLKVINSKYNNVSSKAGLKKRPERMSVPSRTQSYVNKF